MGVIFQGDRPFNSVCFIVVRGDTVLGAGGTWSAPRCQAILDVGQTVGGCCDSENCNYYLTTEQIAGRVMGSLLAVAFVITITVLAVLFKKGMLRKPSMGPRWASALD